jgi:hypothetical protein
VEGAAGGTLCALPASGAAGSLAGCLVMNVKAAVIRLAPMMATPMNVGRGCLAYSTKHSRSHFMMVLAGDVTGGSLPARGVPHACPAPGNIVLTGFAVALSFGSGSTAARAMAKAWPDGAQRTSQLRRILKLRRDSGGIPEAERAMRRTSGSRRVIKLYTIRRTSRVVLASMKTRCHPLAAGVASPLTRAAWSM